MKKNITLVDVASAKCIDNYLFYSLKNGSLFFNDEKIFDNVESHSYWFKEPYIYLHDNNGNHVLLNINTKSQQILGCGLIWFTITANKSLCSYDLEISGSECTWKTGLFDLEKLSIIDEITKLKNTSIAFYINNIFWICYLKNNCLGGFSNDSGTYLWETDLSEYCKILSVSNEPAQGMIRQVLGVWGDKLWVYTDARILLGLSLETGEVLHDISIQETHPDLTYAGFSSAHFEEKNGLVSFMAYRYYMEFDLATLKIHRLKSFDTGNPNTDWNFGVTNTFTEDYVYFTANLGRASYEPYMLGVLNRSTLEVEWSINIMTMGDKPIAGGLNQAPQSDGNKIYILDSLGTLHIFEKTEDN